MTAPVQVREVDGRRDLDAFLALPLRLRRDDPLFVPTLEVFERRRLSPKNPLFRDGRVRLFLAVRDEAVVGRISVFHEAARPEADVESGAWFGHFEAVDDPAVVAALVDRADAEGRGWGATRLRGPRNLTRLEQIGFTVEGFDTLPPLMQGHHPRWYAQAFEALGFHKHHDLLAFDIDTIDPQGRPVPTPDGLANKAAAVDIPGLEVRPARWLRIGRDLDAAYEVFDAAYRRVPDASPMPRATFQALGRSLLAFADAQLVQLAFVHGRPAGFAVCMPEMNEAIRATGGRLWPLGWLRLLAATRRIRTASFKLIGVLDAYRGTGLHALMVTNAIEGTRRAGYSRIEASVIHEDNKPMRGVVEGAGMKVYRRYRTYERPL